MDARGLGMSWLRIWGSVGGGGGEGLGGVGTGVGPGDFFSAFWWGGERWQGVGAGGEAYQVEGRLCWYAGREGLRDEGCEAEEERECRRHRWGMIEKSTAGRLMQVQKS